MKAWRGDLGKAVDRNDAKKRKPGRGDTRNGAKPKAQGGRGTASFFLGEQRGGAPAAAAVRTRVAARALAEGGGNCAPVCPGWDQERRAVAVWPPSLLPCAFGSPPGLAFAPKHLPGAMDTTASSSSIGRGRRSARQAAYERREQFAKVQVGLPAAHLRLRGGGCAHSKASAAAETGRGQPVQPREQATGPDGWAVQEQAALVQLAGGLKLKPVQVRLIERMFAGCLSVIVTRLHGGLSGSLVLMADSVDADGRQEEPTVVKLDMEQEMRKEVKQTKYIAEQAGEGVIEIRRDAIYLDGHGAVLIEMAGACWVMPEFYKSASKDLISTLKSRVTAQLVDAGVEDRSMFTRLTSSATRPLTPHVDGSVATESLVATLRELWSAGSPLRNLALKTAKREAVRACDAGGRVSTWLGDLAERLMSLFLLPKKGSAVPHNYQPPSALADALHSLNVRIDPAKHTKRFNTSFVHELGSDTWGGDASLPLQELVLLLKELATPESWLAAWSPLICHAHGDLNFGNVLIDARDSLWLIDVRTLSIRPPRHTPDWRRDWLPVPFRPPSVLAAPSPYHHTSPACLSHAVCQVGRDEPAHRRCVHRLPHPVPALPHPTDHRRHQGSRLERAQLVGGRDGGRQGGRGRTAASGG